MKEKSREKASEMAEEIYEFLEERYANSDLGTRDLRRALLEVVSKLDLYELLYEAEVEKKFLIRFFEKGYRRKLFRSS